MDELEYDIYDDLDVFRGNEKQQKECESCTELREQLNNAQQQNAHLSKELNEIQKKYEALEVNSSALLKTARQEIQRKDTRIKDLQKEKDDILFRRKRVKNNIESRDAMTQSRISCKPFLLYELKCADNNESCEKSTERNNRHDENHKTNPFVSKSKENYDVKTNHLRNLDKNSSHRHQSRHQDDHISLRSKHNNHHRPKDNERREQMNDVERTKRRRSPSVSKDHKRMRRSRSRSRSRPKRDRERNVIERNSPDKTSHNSKSKEKDNGSKEQQKRRSPHRSPQKHDLRTRLRNKREKNENNSHRHVTENHVESSKMAPKDDKMSEETIATKQTTELAETETETERTIHVTDEQPSIKIALEEGEIEDSSNDIDNNFKSVSHEPTDGKVLLPEFDGKFEVNGHNVHKVDSKIEEKKNEVPKLAAVSVIPTAKVHIACTTPNSILLHQNDCMQQQQQQQCQLMNGIAHNTTERNENVAEKLNGIPMETQSLGEDDDASEEKVPIVNECEIVDTVNNQNQLKGIVEDNPVDTKQPQGEIEIEPEVQLENHSQHHNESIPQINDCNNSTESQNKIEPNDDSSNSTHNTSGSKSVNISTSYKDYLIVEDDNNEQIIYVTRKKKKKKKKGVENV